MQTPLDELYDQYNRFVPDAEIQSEIEECHRPRQVAPLAGA